MTKIKTHVILNSEVVNGKGNFNTSLDKARDKKVVYKIKRSKKALMKEAPIAKMLFVRFGVKN